MRQSVKKIEREYIFSERHLVDVLKLKGRIKQFGLSQRKSDLEKFNFEDPSSVLWFVNTVEIKNKTKKVKKNK